MRSDKLIPGLILVMIGLVFLLNNFDVIDFHWGNVIRLWPIFLVIGGVNLVFAHNRTLWASTLKVAVVLLGFGLLIFGRFGDNYSFWPNYHFNYHHNNNDDNNDNDDSDDEDDNKGVVKVEGNSTFTEPYSPAAREAQLHISGGGTSYILNDTTGQLFKADTHEYYGRYEFNHSMQDSTAILDFSMKNRKGHFNWGSDHKSNSATIFLNPYPIWNINIDAGATELNFDLSKFKVKDLRISGGAASFKVKVGQPLATTNIDVSTGVSEVEISIPQNAACEITSASGLSSSNFDGFTKKDNGVYTTAGFENAKNKLLIRMTGGISDFKVHRY